MHEQPEDYGWKQEDGSYKIVWFRGNTMPEDLCSISSENYMPEEDDNNEEDDIDVSSSDESDNE